MSQNYNSQDKAHKKKLIRHILSRVNYSPRSQHLAQETRFLKWTLSYAASVCRALCISSPPLRKLLPSHSYWINQSDFIFIAPFWKIRSYPFPVILKRMIIHTTQLRMKHMSSWWCLSGGSCNCCWLLKLLNVKGKIDYWDNTCKQMFHCNHPKEKKHFKKWGVSNALVSTARSNNNNMLLLSTFPSTSSKSWTT